MISFHQFVYSEASPPPPAGGPKGGPPGGGPPPGGPTGGPPMGLGGPPGGGPPMGLGGPPGGGPPGMGASLGGPPGASAPEGQPQALNKVQKIKSRDVWDALKKSLKKSEGGQEKQQDV